MDVDLLIQSQVEGFWGIYCHLARASTLPNPTDLHLFKEGIRPLWEVSFNASSIAVLVSCHEDMYLSGNPYTSSKSPDLVSVRCLEKRMLLTEVEESGLSDLKS